MVAEGVSDYEIARRTGVSRGTVLNWRSGGDRLTVRPGDSDRCDTCGAAHSIEDLDRQLYSYLLGQYLGDGSVWQSARTGTCRLRISCDAKYSGIIAECTGAIESVRGRAPYVRYERKKRLATITSYWRAWPCPSGSTAPEGSITATLPLPHGSSRSWRRIPSRSFGRSSTRTDGAARTVFTSRAATTNIRATSSRIGRRTSRASSRGHATYSGSSGGRGVATTSRLPVGTALR
jgi:hypothetical protein